MIMMAAAAYKGLITFTANDGWIQHYRISATDTTTVYWTAEDGLADFQLPVGHGSIYLASVKLVTGGTDCRKIKVWVNGKDRGCNFRTLDNLNTSQLGSVEGNPPRFDPGDRVAFQQLTQAT